MSSTENTSPGASLLTQLVLEVYLAAWTRSALEDEERLPPVAVSSDEGARSDADGLPDLDHLDCIPRRRHISVQRTTGFRYVHPVGHAVTGSGRGRRPGRRRECLHRRGGSTSVAGAGLHFANSWKGR
jgi:hypothetical protein